MTSHTHAFKEERLVKGTLSGDRRNRYAECGDLMWRDDDGKGIVTCPKCSAIVAKRKLKERPELSFGESIRDKAWLKYTYRSIWPLKHQGKTVGFAIVETGWGGPWRVLGVNNDGSMRSLAGYSRKRSFYHAKEEVLLDVPELIASGVLYAPEDAEGAIERRREADRLELEEQNRQAAERKRVEDELREAFESIAKHPLTNQQRDALAIVYKRQFYRDLP